MLSHPSLDHGEPHRDLVGRSLPNSQASIMTTSTTTPTDHAIKGIFAYTCTCACSCVCVPLSPACLRLGRSKSRFGPCSLHAQDDESSTSGPKYQSSLGLSCPLLAQSGFTRRIAQRLCPTLPGIVVPLPGTAGHQKVTTYVTPRAMGTVASWRTRGTHTNSTLFSLSTNHNCLIVPKCRRTSPSRVRFAGI